MLDHNNFQVFLNGVVVCGSLIIAIGIQNAYVLKRGLLKQHIFLVCSICFACDILLMSAGVFGIGKILQNSPHFSLALSLVGAIFLLVYAFKSAQTAWRGNNRLLISAENQKTESLAKVIALTLAITLLNPGVYVDTILVVGGFSNNIPAPQKIYFLAGALFASVTWFFGLGYGARLLIPVFSKRSACQLLDYFVALLMLIIAVQLLIYSYELWQQINGTIPAIVTI